MKKQGGFNEPYCSEKCYNEAGTAYAMANIKNLKGICGVCKKPITVGIDGGMILYNNQNFFYCDAIHSKNCVKKVIKLVSKSKRCVLCGKKV